MAEAGNRYLQKGSQVYFEGRLMVDSATGGPAIWTRQDSRPVTSFEIHAGLIRFLGGKNPNGNSDKVSESANDPEIPFKLKNGLPHN